ncbi:MAG: High-affnity carbon uptake protein Hat/HatR, partial [Leptolyngbya sp. SIO3F4]|nr:High-affnity carbon uptake protein Hat/HatR [Leptolyngbya sp. SIO3F4]
MIATDIQTITNPFPGLRPFRTDEAHLFFGREGQVDEVLDKLEENRFVAVLGASGSGKSSLMYCGLIPSLYGGFMTEAGSNWRIVVTRPGISPIKNLNKATLSTDRDWENLSKSEQDVKIASGLATLRSSSLGLVEFIEQQQKEEDEHFLILVDQFEELFRFSKIANDTASINESFAFVKLLLEAIKQSNVPIYIVMTMRSDYIGDCAYYPFLTQLINDSHYLIPKMTRAQKKSAILGPAAIAGGVFSSRLLQQVLNDIGDKQDDLPILQHALMRTWEVWQTNKDSKELDIFHYESI